MTQYREPNKQGSAYPSRWGWYYVVYEETPGYTTGLMTKHEANNLAMLWKGKVHRHSKAPKWWQFWISPPARIGTSDEDL